MLKHFPEPLDEKTAVLKTKIHGKLIFPNERNPRENEYHTVWLHVLNFGI
jgi:hypothetical protein